MTFRSALNRFSDLKFIYEKMIIKTSMGRNYLLNKEFSTDVSSLQMDYDRVEDCIKVIKSMSQNQKMFFECILYDIHDVGGSLTELEQGRALDDISLFEIKAFCLAIEDIRKQFPLFHHEDFVFESFEDIISILDKENTHSKQFYIYDGYDDRLPKLRKEFEQLKLLGDEKSSEIYSQIIEIETEVRKTLSNSIRPHTLRIRTAIKKMALLDISLSIAEMSVEMDLVRADIQEKNISYKHIFNPIVKAALNKNGKDFQAIDVDVISSTLLITGANMAGKTVVLKTLALNQLMAQFGMYVCAEKANIALVEDVLCSIGDGQNLNEGLSSFAAEILTLDSIVKKVKSDKCYLVLVDELARTTSPLEGLKLLNGFLKTLSFHNSYAVVTTHYSGVDAPCVRYRVKGFISENLTPPISIDNLTNYLDYSLIKDSNGDVPYEALNLCRLLAIDEDWYKNSKNSTQNTFPFIDKHIGDYLDKMHTPADIRLKNLERTTHLKFIEPEMVSGTYQGEFLSMITSLVNPKRILEIGTFSGFATTCFALQSGKDCVIDTIEAKEEYRPFLEQTFKNNDIEDKINMYFGQGLDIVQELEHKYDIIFLDAEKAHYHLYFPLLYDKLNNGGVLLADNILWYGKVAHEEYQDKQTTSIRQYSRLATSNQNLFSMIIPIRDGIMFSIKNNYED